LSFVRVINFSGPIEKQQHDAVVALVDKMLQLQKEWAEQEKDDRRHALKQRLDA
jgi:hypothetical protein